MKVKQNKNITKTVANVRVGIEMIEGLGVSIGIYGKASLFEDGDRWEINTIIEELTNRYAEDDIDIPREVYSYIREQLEELFDYE